MQGYWLLSLTPVTYLSKLLGIISIAAYLQLELFRIYIVNQYFINRLLPVNQKIGLPLLSLI
ncbi:hypothetical protein COO51_19740 [Yersinia enterocolitica]|nr:hypothetical protein COO51_19740 [Yersinia enterocolitica]